MGRKKYVPPPDHPYKRSFRKMLQLSRMIASSDEVTRERYQRLRDSGMDQEKATLEALHLRAEDRRFAEFDGPLKLVDGRLVYFPGPTEKRLPWDPPPES